MKVLHLVNSNAYHALLLDVARHLQSSGVTVVLGTLDGPGALHQAAAALGIPTLALGVTGKQLITAVLPLAWKLRREGFDVVHTHLTQATLVGLTAARLAGVAGRTMTRHHSDERVVYGSRKGVLLDRFIGKVLCRNVVAISGAVERALTDLEGIPPGRIRRVPNGYDWDRVQSSPEAAARIRTELGLGDQLVLCHVGRITWVPAQHSFMKGQDRVIAALARANLPADTRVIFVGAGPDAQLKAQAERLGVAGRCHFVGQRRDCFDIMAASDLMVHPSLHEAQCQVIIEAMALGRPVIASDVGAAEDIVLPGKTGWLIPARDDDALVRALEQAAAQRPQLAAMGRAGQELVRRLYPIERMASGYASMYREFLAS